MNYRDNKYLSNITFQAAEKISEEEIFKIETELGITFPNQYKDFIMFSNGAEGVIGQSYIVMWRLEEIMPFYEICCKDYMPEFIMFASDGATQGYAFDTRSQELPIVALALDSIDYRDVKPFSNTLDEFFEYLYNFDWD